MDRGMTIIEKKDLFNYIKTRDVVYQKTLQKREKNYKLGDTSKT